MQVLVSDPPRACHTPGGHIARRDGGPVSAGKVTGALVAAACVGALLAGTSARASADAGTRVRVVVSAGTANRWSTGPITYGYDLKRRAWRLGIYGGTVLRDFYPTGENGQPLFGLIRMPMYMSSAARGGAFSRTCVMDPDVYTSRPNKNASATDLVRSVRTAQRAEPGVGLYVNLVEVSAKGGLPGGEDFAPCLRGPDWPRRYASAVAQYLRFLRGQGVSLTHLDIGVLNEISFRTFSHRSRRCRTNAVRCITGDPHLTAFPAFVRAYVGLVNDIKKRLRHMNVTARFVAADSYGPPGGDHDLPRAVDRLDHGAFSSDVGIASTHFYAADRAGAADMQGKLAIFAAATRTTPNGRTRPVWDTEFHAARYDPHVDSQIQFAQSRDTLLSLFAGFDDGVSSVTMWDYGVGRDNEPAELLAAQTAQAIPLTVPRVTTASGSQSDTDTAGHLVVRAFYQPGNPDLYRIWLVNDTAKTLDTVIALDGLGRDLDSAYQQSWIRKDQPAGGLVPACLRHMFCNPPRVYADTVGPEGNDTSVTLSARSITAVTMQPSPLDAP